jgi:hypothetical protein
MVARSIAGAITGSTFRSISFVDPNAAIRPRLEDLVIAMLHIDPLGARRIVRVNRSRIDGAWLLKRILQEDAEGAAASVRLDELLPNLRPVARGHPWRMSRRALAAEDRIDYGRDPSTCPRSGRTARQP